MSAKRKYYGTKTEKMNTTVPLIVMGWVAAVISLFIYPFIFGIFGVVMGIATTKRENSAGIALIVASIVFMSIGLVYGQTLNTYLRLVLGI